MEEKRIKEIFKTGTLEFKRFVRKTKVAERYLIGDNDIKHPNYIIKPWLVRSGVKNEALDETKILRDSDVLRQADNRVACTYYPFLVQQKAVYNFGNPLRFDFKNKQSNDVISDFLGGHWSKTCKNLSVNASNAGVAWLHTWIDENNNIHYGVVDSKQIHAKWGGVLGQDLIALKRVYNYTDPETGDNFDVIEYWDNAYCYFYKQTSVDAIEPYNKFLIMDDAGNYETSNKYLHGFSKIPFSAFFNNQNHTNDLEPIKGYIDTFDKAFSIFIDNLEDVQSVILVLENLGGTSLQEFKASLRREKAVKVINNDQMRTDVRTLTIEVPVEALQTLIDMTRKFIFEMGQGVDPLPENYSGNTSGEALKYMYANLELKCMALKDEFEIGFHHFLSLVCEFFSIDYSKLQILWGEPTKVNNVVEAIDNVKNSVGIVSTRTLLNMHPAVDDVEEELSELEREKEEKERALYGNTFESELVDDLSDSTE